MPALFATRLRALALATAALVTAGMLSVVPAHADTAPPAGTPETVSTDALPTAQIDGIVWAQVIIGNTVYAGGHFSTARPAGADAGVGTVTRTNLLSYNLTTGELTSFAPVLNGDVTTLAASPDGTRVYAGGTFTSVGGVNRYRVAAFDTATGALATNFAPSANASVGAIAVTPTTVYLGGNFTAIGSATRTRLAAISVSTGALVPTFAPAADGRVRGIVVSPDQSKIVAGGAFTTLNGSSNPGYGMGAVSTSDGALLRWDVNSKVRDGGANAAIYSLTSDGDSVYGTGYHFGTGGNLEGAFRADWANGALIWVEDCHGDTYSGAITGNTFYTAGHPHYCGTSGGFPQTTPPSFQRGMAWSKATSGRVATNQTLGDPSWVGTPVPSLLNWWPDFNTGTVSGSSQGPWSIAANADYVVYAGEFTRVNNIPQQGLVRFAVKSIAPNRDGPRLSGANFVPKLTSPAAGVVNVTWLTNYDRDNQFLTYDVIRDGNSATPAFTAQQGSRIWWDRPTMGFYDQGLAPGTHTYKLRATDPSGNIATGDPVTITLPDATTPMSAYANGVLSDGASAYWRLGDPTGTTLVDSAGTDNAVASHTTAVVPGAIAGDSDGATSFDGTSAGTASSQRQRYGPDTFTVEAWVKTTSTTGGKIVGFGNKSSGNSGVHDRSLYFDNAGRILFGIFNGAKTTVQSGTGFNNGQWHHVVGALGSDGMRLFIDGAQVAQRTGTITPDTSFGFWRIGGDSSWAGTSGYLKGTIDEVAVYNSALPAATVARHYQLAKGTATNAAPVASFTATPAGLTVNVDGTASADPDGTISSYSWDWGDKTTPSSGVKASHSYAAAGTYTITLTVADNLGATGTTTRSVTVAPGNAAPVASFTATATGLSVAFDGTASTDPDGTIANYSWDFGDGSTGSGATTTHPYASAKTYTVTLTVTDNLGTTGATSKAVSVTAPPPPPANLATDAFERTVTGGFGTADTGGAWTVTGGAANFSVGNGVGSILTATGAPKYATLSGVSSARTDVQTTATVALPSAGTLSVGLLGRVVGATGYVTEAQISTTGAVSLSFFRQASTTSFVGIGTASPVAGLTVAPGDQLQIRMQVVGTSPTSLAAKVWKVGTAEPAWQAMGSDSTAGLQVPGGVGVISYLSAGTTVTTRLDNLSAVPVP